MGVYYHKLWAKMAQMGVRPVDLIKTYGFSPATVNKLKYNEYVSLEVLDRLCTILQCDYGELLSNEPQPDDIEANLRKIVLTGEASQIMRNILKYHMTAHSLNISQVAAITGVSLNTLKKYLSGGDISSSTHLKLLKLGKSYISAIGHALNEASDQLPRQRIYCNRCGTPKGRCFGSHSQWQPEDGKYHPYCAFGFDRQQDENGAYYTTQDCPHPRSANALESAIAQYPYKYRGKVEIIE